MRKIIESTLMSVDAVVGDPAAWGVMDYRDAEVQQEALERLSGCDAMLMGRRTYEAFAKIWPPQTTDLANRLNGIRKYVFSSTLEKADWNNSTIMRGDVAAQVTKLKQQDGRDLAIYGHGLLGQTLLAHGLLDELQLSIHPLLVGSGMLLFRDGEARRLRLVSARTFGTGVVVLSYQPTGT
jgi:dihydrofolate reductase